MRYFRNVLTSYSTGKAKIRITVKEWANPELITKNATFSNKIVELDAVCLLMKLKGNKFHSYCQW